MTGRIIKGKTFTVIPQAFSYGSQTILGLTEKSGNTPIDIIDDDFNTTKTLSPGSLSFVKFYLSDWRTSFGEEEPFFLSQTLFNDDEAIEYAVPLVKTVTEEVDTNDDGVNDDTFTYDTYIGFRIANEYGTVLQDVMFDNNFQSKVYSKSILEIDIMLIGNKCYLQIGGKVDGESATLIYAVDRKTGTTSRCDVNEDGAVDVADIATVITEMASQSRK